MASSRRSTSRYSLDDDNDNDNDMGVNSPNSGKPDATAEAFANIQAQLASFTSPKLGTVGMSAYSSQSDYMDEEGAQDDPYGMDPVEWMRQELDADNAATDPAGTPSYTSASAKGSSTFATGNLNSNTINSSNNNNSSTMMMTTTPKKTPILERADTPVMSNSSKKKKGNFSYGGGGMSRLNRKDSSSSSLPRSPRPTTGADADGAPAPMQTPIRRLDTPGKSTIANDQDATMALVPQRTPRVMYGKKIDQRYHEALHMYLKDRRSLSERMDLEEEERALGDSSAQPDITSLAANERKTEIDFLRRLRLLAWDESSSTSTPSFPLDDEKLEGNTWMLLARLRNLGLASIMWADDPVSNQQHAVTQTAFLKQVASLKGATDKHLLSHLSSDKHATRPLVLQRRHEILKWIQACFDDLSIGPPPKSTKTAAQNGIPDEIASLIGENTPCVDQALLKSCFSQLLAGKLEKAQQFARDYGQPWRASVFGGGQPHGVESIATPLDVSGGNNAGTRIVGNPHRFLWKQQMWKNGELALTRRPEESAICSFLANDAKTCFGNSQLRTWEHGLAVVWTSMWGRLEDQVLHWNHNHQRDGFPELKQEQQQLMSTMDLENMSNAQVIQMLSSSPFVDMQGRDEYRRAMAAILIGKGALIQYIVAVSQQCESFDVDLLRFLTHLVLYLDSWSACSTPIILDQLEGCKNTILFEYVQYLASQPDMWNLLTLYVSLLPDAIVMQFYPQLLAEVMENRKRNILLEQARDLFASPGMDLQLVRRVVRILLKDNQYQGDDPMNDVIKSRSIEWLLEYDEHYGDALICANILLREFFASNDDAKMESAAALINDYLPDDLADRAGKVAPDVDDGVAPEAYHERIEYAKREHLAFVAYLEAYASFGNWKDVIASKPVGGNVGASAIDARRLNRIEQKIMQDTEMRHWIKQVSQKGDDVIEAATQAQQTLFDVLSLPRGWLSIDEEPVTTVEDKERERQIKDIRSRYVVLAVNLYLQVCQDTASWMARTLDDAVPAVFATRKEVLQALNRPAYSPIHWYQTALDLAETVADDKCDLYLCFDAPNLQDFMSKMAEITVTQSMEAVVQQ